jgi:hypothetical protein
VSASTVATPPSVRAAVDIAADERTQVAPARSPRRVAWAACAGLLLAYAALSFVIDVRGTLLADSGGKLATLEVMAERGTLDPDVGYWAAADDPDGVVHPLRFTSRRGDEWVQATTLPMLYAAVPLYELGGLRGILVLPMLGGVLTALAARAIARRLGSDEPTAWIAFWAVGLLTPVVLYALAFWEHTLGLAGMLWAMVLALDALETRDRRRWLPRFLAIGVLFGIAASMRTEALVYFATTMAVVGVALLGRRTPLRSVVAAGCAAGAGLAALVAANELLERAVIGGSVRVARASSTVAGSADAVWTRVEGAVTSVVGINGFGAGSDPLVGAAVVLGIVLAVWLLSSRQGPRTTVGVGLLLLVGVVYVARFAVPAYLPGLLVASPLAAAGIGLTWSTPRLRTIAALALVPLPLIWATQFLDTQRFQWGNRFALVSGILLAVVAVVVLASRRPALVGVLVLSLVVTTFAVLFLVDQTHSIADGVPRLVPPRDALVVSTEAHLWREGGAFYEPGRRWLAAGNRSELTLAARVARRRDLGRIMVVAAERTALPASIGDYGRTRVVDRLEILPHGPVKVVEYRAP